MQRWIVLSYDRRACEMFSRSSRNEVRCWIRRKDIAAVPWLLFLRLGGEQQRVALHPASVGSAGRLGLGNVLCENGDDANAAPVRCNHDLVRLVLGHAELR